MSVFAAGPVGAVENEVILPKRGCREALADHPIPGKDRFKKVNLKIIGFLKSDNIRMALIEERSDTLPPVLPTVGTVVGQTEA